MARKATTKDWYWEAEQDKIASDDDLRFVPSPEGWPSQGLDTVGLWFLILNEMARSKRKGYLSDPFNGELPLTTDALAFKVGRPVDVVARVLEVILARNLFSKTASGIIYSRGMVRREELRKKRSKSGKKGGLKTKGLLEQIVKQSAQQTLRVGIEESNSSSLPEGSFAQAKFDDAAGRLAFVYRSHVRGRRPDDVSVCVEAFAEMLAMGLTESAIDADLRRGPPARDRSEHLWQIKARLFRAAGIGNGKTDADLMGGIAAFANRGADV